jgi:hypothetical protein
MTAPGDEEAIVTTPAPVTREGDDWDTMLVGLSIERVRSLLEDATGTLEQVVPSTDRAFDPVLGQLRRLLAQLGERS